MLVWHLNGACRQNLFIFLFFKKKKNQNLLAHMQSAQVGGFILLSKSPHPEILGGCCEHFHMAGTMWAKKKIKRHRESVGAAQLQQDSTHFLCCVTASDCREPDLPVQLKRAGLPKQHRRDGFSEKARNGVGGVGGGVQP